MGHDKDAKRKLSWIFRAEVWYYSKSDSRFHFALSVVLIHKKDKENKVSAPYIHDLQAL
jgi:hypothetical protein